MPTFLNRVSEAITFFVAHENVSYSGRVIPRNWGGVEATVRTPGIRPEKSRARVREIAQTIGSAIKVWNGEPSGGLGDCVERTCICNRPVRNPKVFRRGQSRCNNRPPSGAEQFRDPGRQTASRTSEKHEAARRETVSVSRERIAGTRSVHEPLV